MKNTEYSPEKGYEEKLDIIRVKLADELEHLYKDKNGVFPATAEEIAGIQKLRNGEKINATWAVVNKIERLARENNMGDADSLHRLYNDLSVGWERSLASLNAEPDEEERKTNKKP